MIRKINITLIVIPITIPFSLNILPRIKLSINAENVSITVVNGISTYSGVSTLIITNAAIQSINPIVAMPNSIKENKPKRYFCQGVAENINFCNKKTPPLNSTFYSWGCNFITYKVCGLSIQFFNFRNSPSFDAKF